MMNKIRTAAISAVVALGALAAAPAHADSFYFGITPHGPRAGIIVEGGHSYHRPPHRWDRGCSAREALRKADRMGINRARIRSANRHSIKVTGRSHRRHVSVRFANAPRCPVIG
jgi:hypothetical protein